MMATTVIIFGQTRSTEGQAITQELAVNRMAHRDQSAEQLSKRTRPVGELIMLQAAGGSAARISKGQNSCQPLRGKSP